MKKILLLLPFLMLHVVNAQMQRFYYQMKFVTDTLTNVPNEELMLLDIDKEGQTFYSYQYFKADSLRNQAGETEFPRVAFSTVAQVKKGGKMSITKNLSIRSYKMLQPEAPVWKLQPEKKTIGKYTVQKATGRYGGRDWVAWFAPEIPFQGGPYLFTGLPGMVLEVNDTQDRFHFLYVGNSTLARPYDAEKMLKRYQGIEVVPIAIKDFTKILINVFQNPFAEYKSGEAVMINDDGSHVSVQDIVAKEKLYQQRLRRNNNPIERNIAPQYPD